MEKTKKRSTLSWVAEFAGQKKTNYILSVILAMCKVVFGAMLKNAPVVILDEATAYTDPENEALVQSSVAKLVQGKTLLVIAHRLSTIASADQIILIKDGVVVASGTQEELLADSPLYRQMWETHISVKEGA